MTKAEAWKKVVRLNNSFEEISEQYMLGSKTESHKKEAYAALNLARQIHEKCK
jgi:hypothetical protein